MQVGYMAIDQFDNHYHMGNVKHPRKWLLEHFNRQHAQRMYRDTTSGKSRHVGWVIAGYWLEVFRVSTLEQ